ncbi:flagellin-like protein [Hahella sp. CCB-MM4]|uniref:flagellin N-terminal helical domain-containing protein n=1 Tax=Hahella sp. (strain CCB-MM4) TaxID=1926491 RepID=UPI000B9B3B9E|nr:flagellin [Hahella sp. CCB-MM4]OZG73132.1 flagellin-like protein [Hahella sp. CCB-MM4]
MAININNTFNNLPPISDTRINQRFEQISSGNRINSAADDPAGLAITNRFDARIGGFNVAIRNAGDGISYTQLASGALGQVTDNLQRIRELSLQAANGTLSDRDRQALQQEAGQLAESTQQILEKTNFNGVSVFTNEDAQTFQTGENAGDEVSIQGGNILDQLNQLGLDELDISTQEGAVNALSVIDDSFSVINERNAEFGAVANRFEATIAQAETSRVNAAEARSRIADTDIAEAASSLISEQIRNQAQIAVRAQANGQAQQVLRLLSG